MGKKWILIILNLIFLGGLTFIGINLLINVDLLKSINTEGETNDFCQTYNKTLNNSTLNYLACDNKFKKKKIILLLIDSLAFDKIYDIINVSETKITNFFKGKSLDYKQSGALFETIFTGKFSRNYIASTVTKYDTLAQQFKNANMDVFYQIKSFPLETLLNNSLMTKKETYDDESFPLSLFCKNNISIFKNYKKNVSEKYVDPSISAFRKNLNSDMLFKEADKELKDKFGKMHLNYNECFTKNNFYSHVYFSEYLDPNIHITYKNYPTILYDIYFAVNVIKEVIKWINEEHDEYALAVASDHGGQNYYGEDALCNHGCNTPGNEAFSFVYTKELGEQYEKNRINNQNNEIPTVSMNDFACIIAQSLKNVNLPLESNCAPRYIGNDNIIKFSSIKSKEVQLKVYIEKLCRKYPKLSTQYHGKYDKKLNEHKFLKLFKDIDSIYKAGDKIFDEYSKYIMKIQDELTSDVIKSGQTKLYYFLFYVSLIFFILGLSFFIRRVKVLTENKVTKKIKKNEVLEGKESSKKMVIYIIILIPILVSESIICLIFHKSKNISEFINLAIFVKFFSLLFFVIIVTYINKFYQKRNYRKIIIVLISIIILHLFMHFIRFFSLIDKNVNTQAKSDFFKIYLSYPLLLFYGILDFYSIRNYYISKKYNIRYIYIVIPYLIFTLYFLLKYDLYVKIHNSYKTPPIILLLKRSYLVIFLLLLFIRSFIRNRNDNNKSIPNVIFNTKLFFIALINFICVENERVILIPLYLCVLFYLCYLFQNEDDMFLKIIYLIIIICYPQIHYIGIQGTYSMDASIKITVKCPSKWADDLPVVMGVIFTVHKFKLYIILSAYLFSLFRRTRKNEMNYYSKIIIYFFNIQLFALTICYLYFLKKEIEHSYIQLLFLIATKALTLIFYELNFLINYGLYNIKSIENNDINNNI